MKLRIRYQPGAVVMLLAAMAVLCWVASAVAGGVTGWLLALPALFYTALTALAGYAWARCCQIERWMDWDRPERLLLLAPHQDDCVICAGGIGIRNASLGGETFIAYLTQDEEEALAQTRKEEVISAWSLAGVTAGHLHHLDVLPPLYVRDAARLRAAAEEIRRLIERIAPTVIVLPMFEAGHVHHDVTNHLVTSIADPSTTRVFEAPEYSPFLSPRWTPHRIVAHCGRWLFGLVAYYGPPDGVDDRPIFKVRLSPAELAVKRRMLAAFVSQNGPSLAAASDYPDRVAEWHPRPYRPSPFQYAGSYLDIVSRLEEWVSPRLLARVLPGQRGTIGREPALTNLDAEFRAAES